MIRLFMNSQRSLKGSGKVLGYFAYTKEGDVLCDGEGCIIAGSNKRMRFYLAQKEKEEGNKNHIIKKTRFGEVMNGLSRGGAYAFDEESYLCFLDLAKKNRIKELPDKTFFKGYPSSTMHFIQIQFLG